MQPHHGPPMPLDVGTDQAGLARVIDAIGTESFGQRLISLLSDGCGADHCSVFEFQDERLARLGAASLDGTDTAATQVSLYLGGQYWRRDPMMMEVRRCRGNRQPVVLRFDIADLPAGELREVIYGRTGIQERIMICGVREGAIYNISVLRSDRQWAFTERQLIWLREIADTLIAALAKHAEFIHRPPRETVNLASLRDIETTIGTTVFPRREAEVCARILYGLSTTGIALDIGVGEESVVTYRKRAFRRLGIATRRELLLWYLTLPRQ